MDFNQSTGRLWCCLHCRGTLSSGERALRCGACGREYPIVAEIPLLVREPGEYFRAERASLLSAARQARAHGERLDADGIYARLPEASLSGIATYPGPKRRKPLPSSP